jgi:hypothetical protein
MINENELLYQISSLYASNQVTRKKFKNFWRGEREKLEVLGTPEQWSHFNGKAKTRRLSNYLKNEGCKQVPSLLLDEMILSNSQNPLQMILLDKRCYLHKIFKMAH